MLLSVLNGGIKWRVISNQESQKIKAMTNQQKAFLINLGFVVFTAFCVEICRASQTGNFSVISWLGECVAIVLLGLIVAVIRKIWS
jgi:hypothetical protein